MINHQIAIMYELELGILRTGIAWSNFLSGLIWPFNMWPSLEPEELILPIDILEQYDEALIILVKDKTIGISHKLKSKGGMLSNYLPILLMQLLRAHYESAQDPAFTFTAD